MVVLSHGQARRIASEWHGGQTSALYALTSAGHVSGDTMCEIERQIGEVERRPELFDDPAQARIDLRALRRDVRARNGRGYVGIPWHARWDDTPATAADTAEEEAGPGWARTTEGSPPRSSPGRAGRPADGVLS